MKNFSNDKRNFFGECAAFPLLAVVFLFATTSAFSQEDYSVPALEHQHSIVLKAESSLHSFPEHLKKNESHSSPDSTSSESRWLPPPGNDNCSDGLNPPYVLSPNVGCTSGSLQPGGPPTAATIEAGETFGCNAGPPVKSVWYSFTATQANMWISVKQTSTPFVCSFNFGIRVYRYSGVCPPPSGNEVGCKTYTNYSADQIYNILNLTGLTAGTTYVVQVVQNPVCGFYDFCIALGTPTTCTTCSNPCGPVCQFAQATPPTPTQVITTCPGYRLSPPLNEFDVSTMCYTFTAINDTLNMQMIVYSYCSPNTFSFTYDLYSAACGLIQSGNVFANNMLTGLTVGANYRICYSVQAACTWDSLVYPYLYTTASALPIVLISFEAVAADDGVELFWATASETNCAEYVVERTVDAMEFQEVSHVRGAGNSTSVLNYNTRDNAPLETNNYYRLKQIDYDGSFTYSRLIAARFWNSSSNLFIIPNPALNQALVKFTATGNYSTILKLTDMRGNVILNTKFNSQNGLNVYPVNLSELPKGIYTVQVISDEQSTTAKLVKE